MLASLRAAWIRAEDWGRVSIQRLRRKRQTYVVEHLVSGLEAFGLEEIF